MRLVRPELVNGPVASRDECLLAGSGLTALNRSTQFVSSPPAFRSDRCFNNGTLTNAPIAGSLNGSRLDLGAIGLNCAGVSRQFDQVSLSRPPRNNEDAF
jgi:hypothetical protein